MADPTPTATTYPATTVGLAAALAALGDTANTVADTLTRGGHTGRPGSVEDCPIARYLAAVIPDGVDIAVGDSEAELNTATCPTAGPPAVAIGAAAAADARAPDATACTCIHVDLSAAVAGFIAAFDTGRYVELAAEPGGGNNR